MNLDKLVEIYQKEVNNRLVEIYTKGPTSLKEPINYVLNGNGKRLRPLLTIFSAEACGGKIDNVISPSLAVEILHNFTLVHDDIMDKDEIRHGKETVHEKWDDSTAILTGDAMLSLALKYVNNSPINKDSIMEIFVQGLLAVCEGQALDKEYEESDSVTFEDYMKMIDMKTGHMLGLSSQIGAISACQEADTIISIRDYGRILGRAFQIQDDYLEVFSNINNMGKSLKSDIILGKKTFLIIHALNKEPKVILNLLNETQHDFENGIIKIREYLYESGIKDIVKCEINNLISLADQKICNLDIDKEKLYYFSNLIRKRGK